MSRTQYEFKVTCEPPCLRYTHVAIEETAEGLQCSTNVCMWCGAPIPAEKLEEEKVKYKNSVYAKS